VGYALRMSGEIHDWLADLHQVAAIERADPGTTDVRTLAAYVEALGGRLEIIAEFAGDRVVLR